MKEIDYALKYKHILAGICWVLVSLIVTSCGGSESNVESDSSDNLSFVAAIADSIVIDRLSVLTMEAVSPDGNHLLLIDEQTNEMVLTNTSGELVSSFNPFVEGPNYMGDKSFGWTFYGNDQLVGYGYTHFVLFNDEGKRLKRLPYPIDVGGWIIMDFFPKRLIHYQSQTKEEVIALIPGMSKPSPRSQLYFDSLDMVYALDFNSETSRPVFRKPAESVYRTIGKYIDHGYPAMDHLKNGKFVVSYASDKNLYLYDAPGNELIKTLEIPEVHQPQYDAVDFGSKAKVDRTKSVGYVMALGDKIAVMVVGRVPESELEKIQGISRWWESPEFQQLQNKYGSIDVLLFDEEKYLGDIEWNIDLNDYRFLGDANGYIWLKRTYEDERDYQTFLKIKIVPQVN